MLLEAATRQASHAKVCIDIQMTLHYGTARKATADIQTGGRRLRARTAAAEGRDDNDGGATGAVEDEDVGMGQLAMPAMVLQ